MPFSTEYQEYLKKDNYIVYDNRPWGEIASLLDDHEFNKWELFIDERTTPAQWQEKIVKYTIQEINIINTRYEVLSLRI